MSSGKDNTPLIEVPGSAPAPAPVSSSAPRTTADTESNHINVPDYTPAPNSPTHNASSGYSRVTDDHIPSGNTAVPAGPPPAYGSEAAPSQINLTTVRLQFGLVLILGFVLALVMNYRNIDWLFKWVITKDFESCIIGPSPSDWLECLGAQGVYRVSFTLFIFFAVHYLVSHRQNLCMEPKSRIEFNHVKLFWKLLLAIGFLFLCFVIPNSFFVFYAWLSFVLSILFLVGQLLVLIEFAYSWAEDWSQREDTRYGKALLGLTVLMIIGAITIIGLGFSFYGFNSACAGNQAALSLTLIAGIFYLILSVHIGRGTIVPASVVFIYTAWTCFSALNSDSPAECSKYHVEGVGQLVFSAIFTAASLVISTLSAATSRDAFSMTDMTETGLEADSMLLQHFHLMMMMASSYLCMLVTNWTIVGDDSMASIWGNRNQASFGAKLGSEALCVILFLVTLVAPLICKSRQF